MQISERFSEIKKLEYLALLNKDNFDVYKKKFPDILFKSLISHPHGKNFDMIKLKAELIVVYDSDDFKNYSVYELYAYLKISGLAIALSEVVKLCSLIITIPVTSATTERSFSALKRIKTFTRSTTKEERLSGLALLSIEKSLLHKMQNNSNFHDHVIDEFIKKTRRMDFIYR